MTSYTLAISDSDGREIARRQIVLDKSKYGSSEIMWPELSYLVGMKAEELFRDALHSDGLFDEYRATRGRKDFWTQR